MKYAENGYVLQVGDLIEQRDWTGARRYPVSRVTKTMAFVQWNERVEGKFPRVFNSFGFAPKPLDTWRTSTYSVLCKDDEATTN